MMIEVEEAKIVPLKRKIKWVDPRTRAFLRERIWHPLHSALVKVTPRKLYRALRPDHRLPRAEIEKMFNNNNQCKNCGGWHQVACPRVKQMTFNGENVAAVEFWAEGQWPKKDVIWPWQLAAMIKEDQ